MNYFKRLTALLLSAVMLFNTTSSVLADTTQTVEYEEGVTANNESVQDVEFTMSKGSTFTVCLPKEVMVDRETSEYYLKAGIYADISTGYELVIEPLDGISETLDVIDFKLSNIVAEGRTAKPDVTAEVTTVKTVWLHDDSDFCVDISSIVLPENQVDVCRVTINDLPSGKWEGSLGIRIALQEASNSIVVESTSQDSTNLNGVSTYITGDTRDTLLNELVQTGYISSEDEIDAIVDVNCDSFEGTATVTFSMRGIANPGDSVAVYHYDESTSTWEFISTEVVSDDYRVTCEFTSLSPVGFSNLGVIDEEHTHSYKSYISKIANCTDVGEKVYFCVCGDIYTEVLAIEHVWDSDYTIDVQPTCTATGSESIHCNVCNATKDTRSISKLEHSYASNACKVCGGAEPGLYDSTGKMICKWEQTGIDIEKDGVSASDATIACNIINQRFSNTTKVVLPDDTTRIGQYAFHNCSVLQDIVIPYSVTQIAYGAFAGTSLKSLVIPNSVASIGPAAFAGCKSLVNVTISNKVTQLYLATFTNCTKLTSVTVPNSVVRFHERVFDGCTNLKLVVPSSVTRIDTDAFLNVPQVTYSGSATGSPWGAKKIVK